MKELNLPGNFSSSIKEYVEIFKSTYLDGLVSVILYGSASSKELTKVNSNINLLVVLNDTSLVNLKKARKAVNKSKFSQFRPVFFTEDYIKNSTDVFPIEFLDMKENYKVVFGKDVLSGLEVDSRNLRFQCEQELKVKLLNIKRVFIGNFSSAELKDLLFRSVISVVHILRNFIKINGKNPSYLKDAVLSEIAVEFGIDIKPIKRILEAKNNNLRLSAREVESLLFEFSEELEKIIRIVDRL